MKEIKSSPIEEIIKKKRYTGLGYILRRPYKSLNPRVELQGSRKTRKTKYNMKEIKEENKNGLEIYQTPRIE